MLSKQKKQNIIKKFQTHTSDTGSSEVQIAILTAEIEELTGHLKLHAKDHSSRRGLIKKVGERRRLLRYLQKENSKSHDDLVAKLKLKQAKTLIRPGVKATAEADLDVEDIDVAELES
jgi:small subunit ribosomal protein S15